MNFSQKPNHEVTSTPSETRLLPVTDLGKTINRNFGGIQTLLRAGNQTKGIKLGIRVLITDVTKNLKVTLAELERSCVQMVESSRRSAITAALNRSELCEACPQSFHLKALLGRWRRPCRGTA